MDGSLLWSFLLIFVRVTSFMVSAPIFSGRQIPTPFKIGLSAVLSILCAGLVKEPIVDPPQSLLFILILKEVLVGIVLGMIATIMFSAVRFAGSLLDLQIGFSMANLFDPTFQTSTQLTGSFKNILAILFLLTTNGHHLLIQGVLASFDWVPLKATVPAWMDGRISTFILQCIIQMFMIGFMMAAPILGTMFVVDIGIGIISRTVPQMNILTVAPPLKMLLHFMMYIFLLPSFFYLLKILFDNMYSSMSSILNIMGA
ncbi:flagellar biosynthetic protein FliR [Bacillus sp. JJ1764]|uniref:flagellar biosynthetic protein FliR n=1 Tax=Bacillus sp. JJ1764 TaxID=3122964 RepID=UPI002FFF82D4